MGIIKYLSSFLPLKILDQMYKALVRPRLDCDATYHIPVLNNQVNLGIRLTSLMETVARTQYQAALAITGAWQGSNRSKLYEELGWQSLSDWCWYSRILQIKNNMTPSHHRDKLPPNRRLLYRCKILIVFMK